MIEAPIIERLAREGVLIIACGGGGIAVEELEGGESPGLEAVIDKDRASALSAVGKMRAEVADDSDRRAPRGHPLRPARRRSGSTGSSVAQAEAYAAEGHFGAGSMGPKIEALLNFVKGCPGGRGVITNAENIERALRGDTGTWIEG